MEVFVLLKPAEVHVDSTSHVVKLQRARIFGVCSSLAKAQEVRKSLGRRGIMIVPQTIDKIE